MIYAVIKAESNFNNEAISHKGAIGVMQIMEETAKEIARQIGLELNNDNVREEIAKLENNINLGTKYLSTLLEKYNNKEIAFFIQFNSIHFIYISLSHLYKNNK